MRLMELESFYPGGSELGGSGRKSAGVSCTSFSGTGQETRKSIWRRGRDGEK